MTAAAALRELAGKATPGKWRIEADWDSHVGDWPGDEGSGWVAPHGAYSSNRADNELMALAPELALWAADAADALSRARTAREVDALLARFASLVGPSQGDGHGSHSEAGEERA